MHDDEVSFDRVSPRRHTHLIVSVSHRKKKIVYMNESHDLIEKAKLRSKTQVNLGNQCFEN